MRSSFRHFLAVVMFVCSWLAMGEAAAVVLTSKTDTRDFIILYSIGHYLSLNPSQAVATLEEVDLSSLPDGEPLYIVAHGDYGVVGGFDADALKTLFDQRRLPWKPRSFYLFSCLAGETDQTHPVSLVDGLATNLEVLAPGKFIGSKVVGAKGCAITDGTLTTENSERVVLNESAVSQLQSTLEEKYTPQADIDAFITNYETKNKKQPSLRELAEYAYTQSVPTKSFFTDLISQSQAYLAQAGAQFKTVFLTTQTAMGKTGTVGKRRVRVMDPKPRRTPRFVAP